MTSGRSRQRAANRRAAETGQAPDRQPARRPDGTASPGPDVKRHRRSLLGAALVPALSPLLSNCSRTSAADLRPKTVEGPPRSFLVVEIIREARTAPGATPGMVLACRWHVNNDGVLFGDHWGWCEDFTILPLSSPGYLLATTVYAGGTTGGYARMIVLPPQPATLDVFGRQVRIEEASGQVQLKFGGASRTLRLRERVALDAAHESVEAPVDTGHFDPGGDRPVEADVTYSAVSYGRLDSRRIAGRS